MSLIDFTEAVVHKHKSTAVMDPCSDGSMFSPFVVLKEQGEEQKLQIEHNFRSRKSRDKTLGVVVHAILNTGVSVLHQVILRDVTHP